jgi:regulator of replication initiation timing
MDGGIHQMVHQVLLHANWSNLLALTYWLCQADYLTWPPVMRTLNATKKRERYTTMATKNTLQSVKAIMTDNKKLIAALTKLSQTVVSLLALLSMAASQHTKLMNENKRIKDENIKLAQQLAEIEAVLASQIVVDTESEISVSVKKPRKPTARKPKPTKSDTTMAVMGETAQLLSVHLPDVTEDELNEEF